MSAFDGLTYLYRKTALRNRRRDKPRRELMNELLAKIIDAHGGLDRWRQYKKVEATIVSGGGLFPLKD